MTNGDIIREMTDEDLAAHFCAGFCYLIPFNNCREDKNCVLCCLEWLQKEAEAWN